MLGFASCAAYLSARDFSRVVEALAPSALNFSSQPWPEEYIYDHVYVGRRADRRCDGGDSLSWRGCPDHHQNGVMVIMSATDVNPVAGEVLFSFTMSFVDKQPVKTCEGFIPRGVLPFAPKGAGATLEVIFKPR